MSISTSDYNERQLTETEIKIMKLFEERERKKREELELQRRQRQQMTQKNNYIEQSGRQSISTSTQEMISNVDQPKTSKSEESATKPSLSGPQKRPRPNGVDADTLDRKEPRTIRVREEDATETDTPSTSQPTASEESVSDMKSRQGSSSRFKIRKDLSTYVRVAENELDSNKFPVMGLIHTEDWNPLDEKGNPQGKPREFLLDDFSFLKNQTLAFKITVPSASREFAINIGPEEMITSPQDVHGRPDHVQPHSWQDLILHFNPRYNAKKKEIMFNSMSNWTWGGPDRRPFSSFNVGALPIGNFTLIIQIRKDGLYVSVNGIFLAFFKHRVDNISDYRRLALQLAMTDDYGNYGNATYHKVWWGRTDPKSNADFVGFTESDKDTDIDEELACSLYVGGLPVDEDNTAELQDMLWEIFGSYFGGEGESSEEFDRNFERFRNNLNMLPGKGYAFITLRSPEDARDAIASCKGLELEQFDDNGSSAEPIKLVVSHAQSRRGISGGGGLINLMGGGNNDGW